MNAFPLQITIVVANPCGLHHSWLKTEIFKAFLEIFGTELEFKGSCKYFYLTVAKMLYMFTALTVYILCLKVWVWHQKLGILHPL